MNIERSWEKALKRTEIIRPRIQALNTFESTAVPYILLSESLGSSGGSLVRKGKVLVERPALILPSNHPQFEGFDMDAEKRYDADLFMQFLMVRGVRFPSLQYHNLTYSLALHDGRLQEAIDDYKKQLQQEENVSTGLVIGPEDCWQFSILIFVGSQILRSADGDIERLLNHYRKKQ